MILFSGTDVSRGTTYWKRTLPDTSVPSMLTMTKWKPVLPFSSRTPVTADIAVEFTTLKNKAELYLTTIIYVDTKMGTVQVTNTPKH